MNITQQNAPSRSCTKSTEYSIHTRRCFITGEYCSQQTNIQKERQRLHEKGEINAFVIMNFSSVSDVVYEARIKPFIKDLKKYLFLHKREKKIACSADARKPESSKDTWTEVKTIHVHRADTNPVSNYIICNRICQQMQMADLIIVDVTVESANVFYEFGLATAFQKLILPICFSDSFYASKIPEKLEKLLQNYEFHGKKFATWITKDLKNHIDCFPWKRKLFEHFGIRYAGKDDHVSYLAFSKATDDRFGFSDTQYRKFPYREKKDKGDCEVGEIIYRWLHDNYNRSKESSKCNTLILYTMDGFLEAEQAGLCIVNFYNNIIRPMHEQYCFCGDRVAVLGQPNKIWDDPKDSKTHTALQYRASDLIRIGMDQATYAAERKRIKTSDYLNPSVSQKNESEFCLSLSEEIKEAIKKEVKTHIRNRTIPLNPDNPIYVTQYKDGIQRNLDDIFLSKKYVDRPGTDPRFSCLYHVMLDTMRYANEIVVDLSSNSIQAMFWLGAAHGSDVYAVTVRHEMSEREKNWSGEDAIVHDRPIFDIGGLWTATLRYDETENFNRQLELIQLGIDQHAKLKLPQTELDVYDYVVYRQLYHASPYPYIQKNLALKSNDIQLREISNQLTVKKHTESLALESYYRDRFWRQLLRDNQLHLFLPLNDTHDEHGPRLQVIKWDMDTVSELSHYLSKRKVIGKYQFDTLRKKQYYGQPEDDKGDCGSKNARNENFISIGEQTCPINPNEQCENKDSSHGMTLAGWINEKYKTSHVREMSRHTKFVRKGGPIRIKQTRGFGTHECQFYPPECIKCPNLNRGIHQGCLFISASEKAVHPLLSTRFYLDDNNRIKARLQCIGPQNASADQCQTDIPVLTTGNLTLKKAKKGEYTVTVENISEKMDNKTLVSLLNILDLRFSPERFAGNPVCLNIHEGIPGNSKSNTKLHSETENAEVVCDMYAQLLLWREEQKDVKINSEETKEKRTEYKYQVSLIGVSGPATKALTALLVDEEQKGRIWGIEGTNLQKDITEKLKRYLPLNTLQTHIRKEFYTRLLKDIGRGDESLQKAAKLALSYLSTILPQYFLPFLSKSDEKRIYNSLKAFLLTIDSKDDPVFEKAVHKHEDTILDKLEKLLSDFRGVDALYNVKVSATPNTRNTDTDNRNIKDIHLLRKEGKDKSTAISCLFITDEKEKSHGKKARTPGDDPGSHHPNGG